MGRSQKVSCALCHRSEETTITGALSTKAEVTAHENCLLFSSGICCKNSPEFDDLFGFSVEDVLKEVKRGNRLMCHYCKKKGATAGCEVKRCKKSYHYPCAVKDGAKTIEDEKNGHYGLYCLKDYNQQINNNGYVNGPTKPGPSKRRTEAGPSKVYCLACEQVEGSIRLDSLSHTITVYCDKHAPPSHKKTNGHSAAASPSVHSNASSSSGNTIRTAIKRPLSESEKQEETPSKRRTEDRNGIVSDDSSDSDENETNPEIGMIPPLESDLDDSANSVPEDQSTVTQPIRADTEDATGSTAGNQQEEESRNEDKDDDETIIDSDSESESLLVPVHICIESSSFSMVSCPPLSPEQPKECSPVQSPVPSPVQHTSGPSVSQQTSPDPPPSPGPSPPGSPPCPTSSVTPAPPETACVSVLSSSRSPTTRPSNSESGINATNFWKSCNAAGCTQAIFTDFINGMNEISNRILSDEASQEDYDLALSVMSVSGKLAELVAKQQEELQRKQIELQKAAAAMKDVVSALRK